MSGAVRAPVEAPPPIRYAVDCLEGCGTQDLTREEYTAQMRRPDLTWRCPRCGGDADFRDDLYDESIDAYDETEDG